MPPPPPSPHRAALLSLAALESLKRDQLVKLAKRFDLKANGKNTELVKRLFEHGKTIHQPEVDSGEGAEEWGTLRSSSAQTTGAGPSNAAVSPPSSPPAPPASRPPSPLRRTASPRHSLRAAYLDQDPAPTSQPVPSPSTALAAPPTPLPDHPAFRAISIYPSLSPNSLAGTPTARPRHSVAASMRSGVDSPGLGIRAVPTPKRAMPGSMWGMESEEEIDVEVTDVRGPTRVATPPPAEAGVGSPPPFVFGSPNAAAATFTFGNAFSSLPSAPAPAAPSTAGLTTAQSIAAQLQARILADRLAAGGPADRPLVPITFTATLGKNKFEAKPVGEKEEQFAGAHKRAFEKMESIADHYAARRAGPSPAKGKGKGKRGAEEEGQVQAPAGRAEGGKDERPGKRSKVAASGSSRNLAGALRQAGWASVPTERRDPAAARSNPSATSARAKGEAALARSQALLEETRAREQAVRRRQLELAKARRKSGAAGLAGASARKERRRSVLVGPAPKVGSGAARFLAGAFKKMVGKGAGVSGTAGQVLGGVATQPGVVDAAARPSARLPSSKNSFALPTATSQAKARVTSTAPSQSTSTSGHTTKVPLTSKITATGRPLAGSPVRKASGPPGKPKFDLEASLARPLSYVPKIGAGSSSLVRSNSSLRMTTTTAGGSPNSTRRASTLSLAGRVGNVGLMQAVRPQGVAEVAEVEVLPDDEDTPAPVLLSAVVVGGGVPMRREEEVLPRMSGAFPSFALTSASNAARANALSAAPEALLTAKSAFCFGPGSAAAALSLGSPIHSLASPRPVLGAHNFLPPSSPGLALGSGPLGHAGEGTIGDLTEVPVKGGAKVAGASGPLGARKKALGTPGKAPVGRKVMSGASRGARELKGKQAVGRARA